MTTIRDVEGLLTDLGLDRIRSRGDEVWASCPKCHDSGNSWSINRESGLSSCFACGYRSNLEFLVMDAKDCNNWEAARVIKTFGVVIAEPEDILAQKVDGPRIEPRPWVPEMTLAKFIDVPDYWLQQRMINRKTADRFGIKWNEEDRAWVLPIRSPGGVLLGWQEKNKDYVKNRPPHMKKSTTVFGAQHLVSNDCLVIVESPLDAARLDEVGFNAVATFGASVSYDQMRMAVEYSDSIILALDNDHAGLVNMVRLASGKAHGKEKETNWASRVPMAVIRYPPDVKDVGDMTEPEIEIALSDPIHVLDWLPAARQKVSELQRETSSVSGTSRGRNGRAAVPSRRLQNGARENRTNYRRH